MNFKNTEIKIDQIVNYLNENKINLSPAFQRGHVWKVGQRKGLLKNILSKKPIPAIFLFKKSDGSKYLYNILDGKQRIESIILFITDAELSVVFHPFTMLAQAIRSLPIFYNAGLSLRLRSVTFPANLSQPFSKSIKFCVASS